MTLNNKILGLELWVWIIIIGLILYYTKNYENFASDTSPGTSPSMVKEKFRVFNFNTSWCGYSKQFQPEWDKLSTMLNTSVTDKYDENIRKILKDSVEIIDIKCDKDENKKMCDKYDVPGYPYILVENVNSGEKFPYNNERTASAIYNFLINNIYSYIKYKS